MLAQAERAGSIYVIRSNFVPWALRLVPTNFINPRLVTRFGSGGMLLATQMLGLKGGDMVGF